VIDKKKKCPSGFKHWNDSQFACPIYSSHTVSIVAIKKNACMNRE
jgi:hypothetical protein